MQAVYEAAYSAYEQLVELGVAREVARAVLPVGAYTEFYWTVNARSLMNFVSLRNSETAQREIRRYAEACERFLGQQMPVTYAAFVANDRRRTVVARLPAGDGARLQPPRTADGSYGRTEAPCRHSSPARRAARSA